MMRLRAFLLVLAAMVLPAAAVAEPARVVALGGDVTEIIFALDEGGRLVGVDTTSVYPLPATKLPQVGYLRNLSAEGIISLKPDLVIAAKNAGPHAVLEQLADAKIPVVMAVGEDSIAGVAAKIDAVAAALGAAAKAEALKAKLRARMASVDAALARVTDQPKTIFLLAQGPSGTLAAGRGSAADAMIKMAHGRNAAAGFEGYKPLTSESAVALAPDVIIAAEHAVAMLGGLDALKARPEIAITPAAKNNRIVLMDAQMLLGFGPRVPDAVAKLAEALHPGVKIEAAALQ